MLLLGVRMDPSFTNPFDCPYFLAMAVRQSMGSRWGEIDLAGIV
jgi:hypothetical protein